MLLYLGALLLVFFSGNAAAVTDVEEGAVGSVCFNDCSGHGRCIDHSCECDIGYDGDDCSFCEDGSGHVKMFTRKSHVEDGIIMPVLSTGHVNLTSSNFRDTLREAEAAVFVAASSRTCHRCLRLEPEYHHAAPALQDIGVVLGRLDADRELALLADIFHAGGAARPQLPALALCIPKRKSFRVVLYDGPHDRHAMVEFARKQLAAPVRELISVHDVTTFLERPTWSERGVPLALVTVIGFFSGADEIEEDEREDFLEAAEQLRSRSDIYFGLVDDATLCDHYKRLGWLRRTSEAVLTRPGGQRLPSLKLWTLLEDNISVQDWIVKESVPPVGRLSNENFAQYEQKGLPMLIMFLELPSDHHHVPGTRIKGSSGGVLNDDLIRELEDVAEEHRGSISCLYADGVAFADSMKSLGLFGSRERLPQVAFNVMDGRQLPFPENFGINRETLLLFCAAFLSGRLRSNLDAQTAMVVARPLSAHNTVRRRERRTPPKEIRGVTEQFNGRDAIVQVNKTSFVHALIDNDKDVLLLFHAEDCQRCGNMVPYYKRVGERFRELAISSVLIAAMDVTRETPPMELLLTIPALPAILSLPGGNKESPFRFYSGVGKVGPIMRWFQAQASTPFLLPPLPHLTEEQIPLFKQQVRERHVALEATRGFRR